jgi:hypothetical protein
MMAVLAPMSVSMNGNQPGDPKLGVARMVDVIKGEGMAKGRTIPWRMPIGCDAVNVVRKRCRETLKTIEDTSTDFPESKRGFWAEQEKLEPSERVH